VHLKAGQNIQPMFNVGLYFYIARKAKSASNKNLFKNNQELSQNMSVDSKHIIIGKSHKQWLYYHCQEAFTTVFRRIKILLQLNVRCLIHKAHLRF
jgi:hypothetical protein